MVPACLLKPYEQTRVIMVMLISDVNSRTRSVWFLNWFMKRTGSKERFVSDSDEKCQNVE